MPAVYIATMMEAKQYIMCRPEFTSGISDDGPEDKRLIIKFTGTLSEVPWLIPTDNGYAIDFNVLINSIPECFNKKWLRNQGCREVSVTEIGNQYIIDAQL